MYIYTYASRRMYILLYVYITRARGTRQNTRVARECAKRPSHILTQSNSLLSRTCVQRVFFTRSKRSKRRKIGKPINTIRQF